MHIIFILPLTIGFFYFFSLLWHYNHGIHGEPLYSLIAGSIILTSLGYLFYIFSMNVVSVWTKINSKSFLLKLFRFIVTPYVSLLWVVRYDYSIILSSRTSVFLSVILTITLLLQSKYHLIMLDNWQRLKHDTENLLGPPPWSSMDMWPIVLFYLFFCSFPLIFPSTFLRYID